MSKKIIRYESRRKFFKAAAITGAAALAAACSPTTPPVCKPEVGASSATHGKTVTLKMQAAWPAGKNIFFEMAGDYVKRVNTMSGGSLKI